MDLVGLLTVGLTANLPVTDQASVNLTMHLSMDMTVMDPTVIDQSTAGLDLATVDLTDIDLIAVDLAPYPYTSGWHGSQSCESMPHGSDHGSGQRGSGQRGSSCRGSSCRGSRCRGCGAVPL